jgi:signal transduction histidine kinase
LYANAAFAKLTGACSVAQVEPLAESLRTAIATALDGTKVTLECRMCVHGTEQTLRVHVIPLENTPDPYALVWFADRTDTVQAHAVAEAQAQRAVKAERSKDQFLATLSHELRTPLATILGWTQLLRGRAPDSTTLENALQTIDRATRSQVRLIDDILVAARVVSGALRLDQRAVDLEQVMLKASEALAIQAQAKELSVEVRTIGEKKCTVCGDQARLEHAVYHLLSNAVKFSGRAGKIEVQLAQTSDGFAQIDVSDDGVGIAPEILPKVFDRFTQGETGLTRVHGGLGLGLSLARHLVEAHGGTLEVRSDGHGCGTHVTMRLPLAS